MPVTSTTTMFNRAEELGAPSIGFRLIERRLPRHDPMPGQDAFRTYTEIHPADLDPRYNLPVWCTDDPVIIDIDRPLDGETPEALVVRLLLRMETLHERLLDSLGDLVEQVDKAGMSNRAVVWAENAQESYLPSATMLLAQFADMRTDLAEIAALRANPNQADRPAVADRIAAAAADGTLVEFDGVDGALLEFDGKPDEGSGPTYSPWISQAIADAKLAIETEKVDEIADGVKVHTVRQRTSRGTVQWETAVIGDRAEQFVPEHEWSVCADDPPPSKRSTTAWSSPSASACCSPNRTGNPGEVVDGKGRVLGVREDPQGDATYARTRPQRSAPQRAERQALHREEPRRSQAGQVAHAGRRAGDVGRAVHVVQDRARVPLRRRDAQCVRPADTVPPDHVRAPR